MSNVSDDTFLSLLGSCRRFFFLFWVVVFVVSYLIHSGEDHRERRDSCLCTGVHNHILRGLGRKRPVFLVCFFSFSTKSSRPT